MDEIEFIEKYFELYGDKMYVAYSGGKDSSVILDMTLKVNPDILIIHNPKDFTHPDTIQHIYETSMLNRILLIPVEYMPFFVEFNGFRCQIDGTTEAEYDRSDKSNDLIINGNSVSRLGMPKMTEKGIWDIAGIFPIRDWSENDVFKYIRENKIPISKEYEWCIKE